MTNILYVDDEPDFLDLARIYLERIIDQLTVISATSAADGLDRLVREPVDRIVSDYQMPRMDGLEFHEQPAVMGVLLEADEA